MKKGTVYMIGGIFLAFAISKGFGGERQSWARSDFKTFQGNYLGTVSKGGRDHILVRNNNHLKSFELRQNAGPFNLPNIGGLMEVHANNRNQILSSRDVRGMYVPSTEARYEGLPTRQGIW